MTPRRLPIIAVLLMACADPDGAVGPNPDIHAAITSEGASLPDDAFVHPWLFIDRIKPDHPIDAVLATPVGLVAVTHAPTLDPRGMPARNNIAAVSVDGVTWQEHPLGEGVHGRALAWGNGVIVLVGGRWGEGPRGSILTSIDGKQWVETWSPDLGLSAVSFVRGRFWAFGERGAFFTSTDGRVWQDQSRPDSVKLNDIAFGNGRYVVVGNVSWLSSPDGQNWSEHRSICSNIALCPGAVPPGGSPPGAPALGSVLFGKGVFVTHGHVGGWISTDGLTWTAAPQAVGQGIFSHGRFISVSREPRVVMVSDDGRSWMDRTSILVSDDPLSCAGRTCLVLSDGILVVPNAGDVLPLPRLPVLSLGRDANQKNLAVEVSQRITVSLQTIGPGQYGEPVVSSDVIRFLDARFSSGPPSPAGPVQIYRFQVEAPGRADIHIPHSDSNDAFDLTLDISPR